MPTTPEPEILRPRINRGADLFSDRNLDLLSHILDDFLRIPGTQIRFGLDGIIGLIPGVGDVIGAMASWIIILAAWLRGVPRVTLARMLANVAIETIIGAVPVIGDAFDIAWKANRRNFALLERSIGVVPDYSTAPGSSYRAEARQGTGTTYGPADPYNTTADGAHGYGAHAIGPRGTTVQERKKHVTSDWLFLLALVIGMMLLVAIPILLLAYLIGKFFAMGAHHA
jgi:Domain of unknown function (DUF4112)